MPLQGLLAQPPFLCCFCRERRANTWHIFCVCPLHLPQSCSPWWADSTAYISPVFALDLGSMWDRVMTCVAPCQLCPHLAQVTSYIYGQSVSCFYIWQWAHWRWGLILTPTLNIMPSVLWVVSECGMSKNNALAFTFIYITTWFWCYYCN